MINTIKQKQIKNIIYKIHGQQVILDFDLALIYGYEVKVLNQQVKRNLERFPSDFMFKLTSKEVKDLPRSQFVTLEGRGSNIKYAPYAFTEQGVYMLSAVLKSDIAIQQSIAIMRAFKDMRHFISEHNQLVESIGYQKLVNQVNNLVGDVTEIKQNIKVFNKFIGDFNKGNVLTQMVVFKGEIVEASIVINNIIKSAKHSIDIIDPYISIGTLEKFLVLHQDIILNLFNDSAKNILSSRDWNNFKIKHPKSKLFDLKNKVHDRFIFIDIETENSTGYLVGGSIKDLGSKLITIIKIEDVNEIYAKVKYCTEFTI